MLSDGFSIAGFTIKYYSLCILIGVIFAYIVIMREGRRLNVKSEFLFNMMFWSLIIGIIGARLYYVVFNLGWYLNYPIEILKIWNGGLAIHGGLLFGLITVILFCKKYNVNTKKILDIIVPGVILAQAFGRWGNFFNREAYGSAITLEELESLKIIPKFVINNMNINGTYHLPMFYFESILCLVGFIMLLIIRRKRYTHDGEVFSTYIIWYGIIRFIIEIFRTDSLMFMNLKVAQLVSILLIIVGIYIMAEQARKPKLENLYNNPHEDITY